MGTVVEQPAVPQLVSSLGALVEVEVVTAVEHVETVKHVLRCVTVHHVQQDGNAHSVRSINELLQVVWKAVAAARSEEAVDLVSETGVVRMLHDGHQLYSVVSQVLDAREDVTGELLVGRYLGLGGGDANVGFVDTCALGLGRPLVLPDVLLGRVPEAGIVYGGDVEVLGHSGDPGGEALLARMVVGDDERDLDLGVVGNSGLTVLARDRHLEDAEIVLGHGRRIAVPAIEITNEVGAQGIRGPLAVDDVAVGLDIEAELLVTLGAVSYTALAKVVGMLARENFSRPPSVSSIVLIHFWALEKRLFSASLKGSR